MNVFNPRNVNCPYCKKTKLRVIEQSGRALGYICAGCGSVFDSSHYTDFEHGIIYYLANRRNPDYLAQLDSGDFFQNLKKGEELKHAGVPFHANTYVIGSKKFKES